MDFSSFLAFAASCHIRKNGVQSPDDLKDVSHQIVSMLLDAHGAGQNLTQAKTDEEILLRSVKNPRFFEELVDRYQEAFLRKALYILKDKETAVDAVQDAFVKMYRNAARFTPEPGAGFKSWGYRILVNTCFTAYKKRKNEGVFLRDLEPEFQELVADRRVMEEQEHELNRDEVRSFLQKLPDGLSLPMRLHFLEGKPHADVAKAMGISEGAVRARVHRAKAELKKLIAERKRIPK